MVKGHVKHVEQPAVVLGPRCHLLFVGERKRARIVAHTWLAHNILVCAVDLLGDAKDVAPISYFRLKYGQTPLQPVLVGY